MTKQSEKPSNFPSKASSNSENPDEVLEQLVEGNNRFKAGIRSLDNLISAVQLRNLAEQGQRPLAIILTCSDSRAPTETLFDSKLGTFFVFRVAGNVLSDLALAGMEYSIRFFNIPLIVVMGHSQCGAIHAAYEHSKAPNKELPTPNLEALITTILESSDRVTTEEDLTWKNVFSNMNQMTKRSQIIQNRVKDKTLRIVGAVYNLASGQVDFHQPQKKTKRPSTRKAA